MASGSEGKTPTTAGKQMSSKLRAKLKRCGRYHCTPASLKHLQVTESPLARRGDSPVTPSPVSKTTTENPLLASAKGACEAQSRGVKRLFDVCSSDDSAVKLEQDVVCLASCTERDEHQECEKQPKLFYANSAAVKLCKRCNSAGCECVSSINDERLRCTSEKESLETDGDTAVSQSDQTRLGALLQSESTSELQSLKCLQTSLQQSIQQKQETIRKLKMVKMYRTKNNLDHLDSLISKWQHVSQQALQDLHDRLPEPKPTLTELVNHLQIDHKLVNFNPDDQSFD